MLSINVLLKAIISLFVAIVVALLAFGTWQSWTKLQTAGRLRYETDAAQNMFVILNNLRVDRSNTFRALDADKVLTGPTPPIAEARAAEMPALARLLDDLALIDFPTRASHLRSFVAVQQQLLGMQAESATAMTQPKSARSPELGKRYVDVANGFMTELEQLAGEFDQLVRLDDPMVDQMNALFTLAWKTRIATGEASQVISSTIGGLPLPANAAVLERSWLAKADAHWEALEAAASPLPLPADFRSQITTTRQLVFGKDRIAKMLDVVDTLSAGKPSPLNGEGWNAIVLPNFQAIGKVAADALGIAHASAEARRAEAFAGLIGGVLSLAAALFVAAAGFWLIGKRVTGPIGAMTGCMTRIAAGRLDEVIPGIGRKDEIGGMASAVEVFRTSLSRNHELEIAATAERERAEKRRKDLLVELASEFDAAIGGIVNSVAESAHALETSAKHMSQTAVDTSNRSTTVAAAAEEASTNVTVVASSAEELGASVDEIGRQVQTSAELSRLAVDQAKATAGIVTELTAAADRISNVSGLISTIAGQTNLLALNATIEAARAGDAGRGFAVVAAEVKGLADQTAKATAEISSQINAIQHSTGRAVNAIGEIAAMIESMNNSADQISTAINQQGQATSEIIRSIVQASTGTGEVTQNISSVARSAKESGKVADEVLTASSRLSNQAGQLRAEVDRFLDTVRAA
ncbi:MAG: HAMP domain-containing methyl-accepting chemotaxis protein [Ancalomicrobiaceae bacterium]|nr:HAMP domain-containing methyl-accepting chemotaxis protein [Ancalomicrobiaceae bacterium]